jgi:predicted ATPase/DNA-binding SARP family transcriptional activator
MDFRILGPLEVWTEDRPIELGSRQQQAFLTLLLLRPNRVVSTDELIDHLWGDELPPAASNTIQTYVSRLRKALGTSGDAADRLITRSPGYLLRVRPDELDAERFTEAARLGRESLGRGDAAGASALLRDALVEWRGAALEGLADEPFAEIEAARLERLRLSALEDRITADLELGRHAAVIGELEDLVRSEPLREPLWELLITALLRAGRRAEALQTYERVRSVLRDELDVEPGRRLIELVQNARTPGDVVWAPASATAQLLPAVPGTTGGRRPRTCLPRPRTTFVGREGSMEAAMDLLLSSQLTTLTGPAGSGKTRLALELAHRCATLLPDGACLVELDSVSDPAHVPDALASAVTPRRSPDVEPTEAIVAAPASRQPLLILDSCEHLLDATAGTVSRILDACPAARIVATSREPLGVQGERVLEVPPLELPRAPVVTAEALDEAPATRLFLDRALDADPGFVLGVEEVATVARICERLDGIPLAIELAATRIPLLGLVELERRLEDRFAILTSGSRSAPPRHRTLAATVDWNYDLLSNPERTLLARLSVFAGGFTLEAAESVCPATPAERAALVGLLGRLVQHSLVVRIDRRDSSVRFRLLETIRAYATDRLASMADADAVHERHAEHFRAFAERAEVSLRGPGQGHWLSRLRVEQDNIRDAIRWALNHDRHELALRLDLALWLYWELDGSPAEGRVWLESALEAVKAVPSLRARARAAAGFLALDAGDHVRAERHVQEAIAEADKAGDELSLGHAEHLYGAVALFTGRYQESARYLETAVERFRVQDDPLNVAWTLHHLGQLRKLEGRCDLARVAHEESLALYRAEGAEARAAYALWRLSIVSGQTGEHETAASQCREALAVLAAIGDSTGVAHATATLGDLARVAGDLERAEEAYRDSLETFREFGDRRCVASTLKNLGAVARANGKREAADELMFQSLQIRLAMVDRAGIAECIAGLGGIAVDATDVLRGARLLGAAGAICDQIGCVPSMGEAESWAMDVATAKVGLGDAVFRREYELGRAMSMEEAVGFATAAR